MDVRAQRPEHGPAPLEDGGLPADDEHELAVPGLGGPAAHRSVETIHASKLGGGGHLAPGIGVDRAEVDERRPGPRLAEHSVRAEVRASDGGRVRQARQHDLRPLRGAGRGLGEGDAAFPGAPGPVRVHVVAGHGVAVGGKPPRHLAAHCPEAYEPDPRRRHALAPSVAGVRTRPPGHREPALRP
jgi:hypothetical protein